MTEKNEMPDLLPCPFCGGDAYLNSTVFAGSTNEYRVNCKECVAQTEIGFTPEEGVEFWNARADLADARVEKLRAVLECARFDLEICYRKEVERCNIDNYKHALKLQPIKPPSLRHIEKALTETETS